MTVCAQVSLRQLPIQPHLLLLGRTTLPCTFHGAQPAFVYVKHGLHNTPAATLAEFLCANGACWLPPHLQVASRLNPRLPAPRPPFCPPHSCDTAVVLP